MNPKIRDLVGEPFGKLTVISYAGTNKARRALWRVRCECGNEKVTPGYALVNGNTTSCGCGRRTHGHTIGSTSKEYEAWTNMVRRCETPGFKDYHDRGILVHPAWRNSFQRFLEDVGSAPSPAHTLDRRDNDGNYEPGNVRWATRTEQQRNTRTSRKHEFRGGIYSMAELADVASVPRGVIRDRLRRGWSVDDAVLIPKADRKN